MNSFNTLYLLAVLARCASVDAVSVSSTPSQKIFGIGASGAWWPNDLYHFPDSVKSRVADLLFGSDGLRLTSYRYNLGGGGVFVGNPTRAPETPFISPGVYNFSADPQGAYFLKQASAHKVPIITAFVNSAPPFFTSNNRSCGGTLVDGSMQGYAQYVKDVVTYWHSQGVNITHISPMNEPDNAFNNGNNSPCDQEGMIVTPFQRAPLVNTLRTTLDANGLQSVGIMADESSTSFNFVPEVPLWLPSASGSVAAVAHHHYDFAIDTSVALEGALGRKLSGGKDTWFTEICCFAALNKLVQDPAGQLVYSQGYDPTMIGGLQMANIMYQSFTQTLDAHFDWWTALSNGIGCDPMASDSCVTTTNGNGWNDGLIYYDPNATNNGNFKIYTTKRYFVMKHFSQFIDVGAVRYAVNDISDPVKALAFNTSTRWTVLVMNMGSADASFGLPTGLGSVRQAIQTSTAADWQYLTVAKTPAAVTLPGFSITTLVFS